MKVVAMLLLATVYPRQVHAAPKNDGLYSLSAAHRVRAAKRLAATRPSDVALLHPLRFLDCVARTGGDAPAVGPVNKSKCQRQSNAVYHLLNVYRHIAKQEIRAGNPYQVACSRAQRTLDAHGSPACALHFLDSFMPIGNGGVSIAEQVLPEGSGDVDLVEVERSVFKKLVEVFTDIEVGAPSDLGEYAFADSKLYEVGSTVLAAANFAASDAFGRTMRVGHFFVFEGDRMVKHRASLTIADVDRGDPHISEIVGGVPLFDDVQPLPEQPRWVGFYSYASDATWHIAWVLDAREDLEPLCRVEIMQQEPGPTPPEFEELVLRVRVQDGRCVLPSSSLNAQVFRYRVGRVAPCWAAPQCSR